MSFFIYFILRGKKLDLSVYVFSTKVLIRPSHAKVGPFCGANAVASFLSYFRSRKSGISVL